MQGNDHSVVRAVLAGDKEAYGTLVRAHSAAVFRVAFRIAGNEADAEEIVQETFLRAYQRLEKFEQRSTFGTWVYRIAVNCALNRVGQPGIEAEYTHGEESDPEMKTVQVPFTPRNNFVTFVLETYGRPKRNAAVQCDCERDGSGQQHDQRGPPRQRRPDRQPRRADAEIPAHPAPP